MTRMQKPIDSHKTLIYGQLKTLQEAKLSLLPRRDCKKFKKTLKVDTRIEVCAGNRVIRNIDAYRRQRLV